ncbi:MAG: type II toxin-antitoxin system RelE/ParE family toxin [Anaerolineae bacterium]
MAHGCIIHLEHRVLCRSGGQSAAREFLLSLPPKERASMLRTLDRLQALGTRLGMPDARHIEGSLWELRDGPNRLFYVAYTGRRFIILHGYRKKSQKAPLREIETAKRRWISFTEENA